MIAARIGLDDGAGIQLTEAGTKKSLSISVVRDPLEVPRIATLGPDPLADAFTEDRFAEVLAAAGRAQIKGVLRDQARIAGIGNAYSDEILHAAKMSPFKPAAMAPEEVHRLYDAMREVLADAIRRSEGLHIADLKGEKKAGMRVHGRTGEAVPGLRRHRAPGAVRGQQPAVLPDLPDGRQAPRRPRPEPPRHHPLTTLLTLRAAAALAARHEA